MAGAPGGKTSVAGLLFDKSWLKEFNNTMDEINEHDADGKRDSTSSSAASIVPVDETGQSTALRTTIVSGGRETTRSKRSTAFRPTTFAEEFADTSALLYMIDPEDTPWINTTRANAYIGAVILLNCVSIGAETDWRPSEGTPKDLDQLPWYIIELMFTMIFLGELILRLNAMGWHYWRSPWNLFDFFVVVISLADVCLLTWLDQGAAGVDLRTMSVLRILRLLRLVRVVRLFRLFQELWMLLQSFARAVKGLIWAMMLLCLASYTCAILMTILLGKRGMSLEDPNYEQVEIRWATVPKSMFTLFIVMTGEGWNEITRDAMQIESWLWVFFVPFVIFTHIMVLNLIVGIIVQEMQDSAREHELELKKQVDADTVQKLAHVFVKLDKDGSGCIETAELQAALENPRVQAYFKQLKIMVGKDAAFMMEFFDKDQSGVLDFSEFVDGAMSIMNSELATQVMFIKYDLHSATERILKACECIMQELGGEVSWGPKRASFGNDILDDIPDEPEDGPRKTLAERKTLAAERRTVLTVGIKPKSADSGLAQKAALRAVGKGHSVAKATFQEDAQAASAAPAAIQEPPPVREADHHAFTQVPGGDTAPTISVEDLHKLLAAQHNSLVVSIENTLNAALQEQVASLRQDVTMQHRKLLDDMADRIRRGNEQLKAAIQSVDLTVAKAKRESAALAGDRWTAEHDDFWQEHADVLSAMRDSTTTDEGGPRTNFEAFRQAGMPSSAAPTATSVTSTMEGVSESGSQVQQERTRHVQQGSQHNPLRDDTRKSPPGSSTTGMRPAT
eukprot:gnl/TRDRNA2_/TRDRNA2_136975_c1_seq2.p1 gnl/TRDRNA2_/TRDRNA2_136975_c1~~gnl/TRDRNA2_/TRDRNA2_136975_c1_seq2.p1  ORF type:complete len:871 (-),score=146.59 gnl/TRDRNA2_/TRDRNA2_136975_c1_seq2:49-2424(-)